MLIFLSILLLPTDRNVHFVDVIEENYVYHGGPEPSISQYIFWELDEGVFFVVDWKIIRDTKVIKLSKPLRIGGITYKYVCY